MHKLTVSVVASCLLFQQGIPMGYAQQTGGTAAKAPALSPAPPDSAKPSTGTIFVKEGTEVTLNLNQDLSSKTAITGDPVMLVLAKDLKVGDVTVAKAGCEAVGEVSNAKKAGMMGKPGELNLRLHYLKVGETKVALRGTQAKEGNSGTTGTVVLTVAFGVVGLLHHGKQVTIPKGTEVKAYLADDVSLPPAS